MLETDEIKLSWKFYLQLGKLSYERGWYAAARKHFQRAVTAIELLQLENKYLTGALLGLGLSCCQLKNFSDAEIYFNRLISLCEDEPPCLDLLQQLSELGVFYQKTGLLEKAETILQKCLDMASTIQCPKLEKSKILKSLALVYCKRVKLTDAEKLIDKAIALVDTKELRTTKLFAEMLGVKSLIAVKEKRFLDAEEWMNQAISTLELATGGEHPELADFLEYAAEVFRAAQLPEQASPLIARAKIMRANIKTRDR